MTVIWHASRHTWLYYGTCFLSIFPCLTCYAVHTSTYARYLCLHPTYNPSPSFCISVFCIPYSEFCVPYSALGMLCFVCCMLYAGILFILMLSYSFYFLHLYYSWLSIHASWFTCLTFTCVLYVFDRVCVIMCWLVLGSLVNLKHSRWFHSHHCSLVSRFTSYCLSWF
jgi:hypothetical protein